MKFFELPTIFDINYYTNWRSIVCGLHTSPTFIGGWDDKNIQSGPPEQGGYPPPPPPNKAVLGDLERKIFPTMVGDIYLGIYSAPPPKKKNMHRGP